jgi:hypothetical protein
MVVIAAAIGAGLSLRHLGSRAVPAVTGETAAAPALDDPEAARFYAAVKVSMVPLLRNLQALQATLVQAGDHPGQLAAGVGAVAGSWAEDMATSRDLVGRLIPSGGPSGETARDLFEHGAALYRESALALSRLPDAPDDPGRVALARSAARLRLFADRVLDLGKRLLGAPIRSDAGRSAIRPEPVPVFPRAAEPCASPVPSEGYAADGSGPTPTTERWIGQNRAPLAEAVAILDGGVAASRAEDLMAAGRRLGGPVPGPTLAGQGTIAIRLALLVEAEAHCALRSSPSGDRAFTQVQRLRLIGDDLWSLGARLFGWGGHAWPKALVPTPTGLDPAVLRTGGLFGGHPPPLRPGDPPDLGVPGGLQLPDPTQVLAGS